MSNQIVISSGAKVRELEGVLTGTSGIVSSVPLGAANGVATLDSSGKVPVSQLPSSVVTYLGTWNAATNTPTLVNGTGDAGDMYICNVAGTVNFGAGPVTFAVGDWVLYGSGTWQKSSGQNGTVTSVAASITGNAVGLTGSPITTAGTLAFAFAGTNLQYVNGAGNLTTFPTLITSIGLSMPSAFSVANSPLTANGTIAVTGAGTTAQYIRGDGSLATFPTIATEAQRLITEVYNETGATLTKGTVVYINGGHGNLPTITKAIATGDATSAQTYGIVQTDITNNNNGYVVVIGSLGDLDTQAYANGTQLYLSSTTAGAWTSVKQYAPAHLVYVGIVVRSHPTQGVVEVRIQNGFEMDELHNVSAQSPLNNQGLFYNTSTSLWENKSIATALGYTPANDALVVHNTGNETIGGTKTFSDATKNNGGIFLQNASSNSLAGYMNIGGLTNGVKFTSGGGISNSFTLPSATGYTFTFPNATGTIALTSDLAAYVPITRTLTGLGSISVSGSGDLSANRTISIAQSSVSSDGYLSATDFNTFNNKQNALTLTTTGTSGAATLVGATLNIPQYTDAYTGTVTSVAALTIGTTGTDLSSSVANSTTTPVITLNVPTASATNRGVLASADWTTFNNKQGTITLTTTGTSGAATFTSNTLNIPNYGSALSGYLPLTGGTLTGALFGTTGQFSSSITSSTSTNASFVATTSSASGYSYIDFINTGASGKTYEIGIGGNGAASGYANNLYFDLAGVGNIMTLTSGRNVLIGTQTDSGYKLDVNGTGRFSGITTFGSTGGSGLRVYGGSGTNQWDVYLNSTNLRFSDNTGTGSIVFDRPLSGTSATFSSSVTATSYVNILKNGSDTPFDGSYLSVSNAANNVSWAWQLGASNKLSLWLYNGGPTSNPLNITTGGNVLIGTTTESTYLLDVNGTGRFNNADGSDLIRYSATGVNTNYATKIVSGANDVLVFRRQHITAGALDIMALGYNGNVGIGTNSPSEKLTVYGAVIRLEGAAGVSPFAIANNNSSGFRIYDYNAGVDRMTITTGGNVLIGTTDDGGRLVSYSTNAATQIKAAGTAPAITFSNTVLSPTYGGVLGTCTSANQFLTGTSAGDMVLANQFSGYRVYVASYSGGVYLTSGATSWTANSDIRLKNINSHIENAVEKLSTLQTINFSYKDDKTNKQNLGLIAQEVEKIFPELIDKNGDGMLGVRYTELVPVLIKAVQELKLEIEILKNK